MGKTWAKAQGIVIVLLLLAIASVAIGYITEFDDDVYLTTYNKGISLRYGNTWGIDSEYYEDVWIYPCVNPVTGLGGIKIPCLGYGAGYFLTTYGADGELVFIATTAYEGDIRKVWTTTAGDVDALTAAADDSLNASAAGSTIPWKVNTTAAPTVEGMAIWDSDDDRLAIGDATSTHYIQFDGNLTIETANSFINQDVTTDADVTFNDITVSTPSNIYALSHDSWADFVAYEHIDWNSTTEDLLTTGTIIAESIDVNDGAADTPTFSFFDATTTGLYRSGSGSSEAVNIAIAGTQQFYIQPDTLGLGDTDSTYFGQIKFTGTAMTADRQLSLDLNNGNRTLRIEADSVINSDLSTNANWGTSGSITGGSLVTGGTVAATGSITGSVFKSTAFTGTGITINDIIPGNWFMSDGTSELSIQANCDLNQHLLTTSDVVHNDLTISTPSNIYALSHDSFADFVADEHIDWTDTTEDFLTIGTLTAASITIANNSYIGPLGDTDLIQLAANDMTVSGDVTVSDLIIGDGCYVGSASDPDAIQIEADGDVVLSQDLAVTGTLGVTGLTTTKEINIGNTTATVPFIVTATITADETVTIYNANAPVAFRVIDVWCYTTGATGGSANFQITDGTNSITNTIVMPATDKYRVPGPNDSFTIQLDDAYWEIAVNGTLAVVNNAKLPAHCIVYIMCMPI